MKCKNTFSVLFGLLLLSACTENKNTIRLQFDDPVQLTVTASDGRRIFFDYLGNTELENPPDENDILLVSHLHSDHYEPEFCRDFPGMKLLGQAGRFEQDGIKVTSLPSTHHHQEVLNELNPSNHVFLVEVDGFRIFFAGSMSQNELTPAQEELIGDGVDIACMMIYSTTAGVNLNNLLGFKMVEMIHPSLVIPGHHSEESVAYIKENYPFYFCGKNPITVKRKQLTGETQFISMGMMGPTWSSNYGLEPWE